MTRGTSLVPALAAVLLGPAAGAAAFQAPGASPYADEEARLLHEVALAARERWDDEVVQYTAVVRQRVGAGLRMPLKDRTLYRSESAQRVIWTRDGATVVQLLAHREQTPLGVSRGSARGGVLDEYFDPVNDRLFFGLVEPGEDMGHADGDDFWFEHPLFPEYRDAYRFSVGDTLTLSLPDGRSVRAVELRVVPREADVHRMTGSLWIEPGSGALVRAVYRLSETFDALRDIADLREEEERDLKHVPGLLKPWTFDLTMVAVDYALWDFDVWLPRTLRAEGVATAGILTAPAAVDVAYEIESVVTGAGRDAAAGPEERAFASASEALEALAELAGAGGVPYVVERGWDRKRDARGRRTVRYLVPADPEALLTSPELPPPVWDDAPGFTTRAELHELFSGLADLPAPPARSVPATLRWGLQRPDLVRYNRVEALSVGVRGQLRPASPLGPVSVTATARLGAGDLEPNVRLDVSRETLHRRVTWSAFRELAAVEEDARHLGLGNSVTALLFGRDDGEYYRRSGTWLEWTPPAAERRAYRVRAYGEYHQAVAPETAFSVWHVADGAWAFRDNVRALEGWELGGLVTLAPWWGTDPRSLQGGLELSIQGAGGDREYARASLVARVAVPLPSDLRLAVEAGGGTSWGDAPVQRWWLLGGATTLRGFAPTTQAGTSYARARGELARHFAFGAVSLFSDAGWAGTRDAFAAADALASAGVGLSLVDGLIRVDAAWGVRGTRPFRLELYLDGIL